MERFVLICIMSFILTGAPGAAENDPYTLGIACFEKLDFSCAIELLSVAARACPREDKVRLVDIYRKLAESQLALGRRAEAVSDFVRLLKIAPDFRLDTPGISPKILDAFSEALSKIEKAVQPPPLPRQQVLRLSRPVAPKKPLSVELGLTAGAELLVGEDRRKLNIGPALDIECNYIVQDPWRIGAGLRYSYHGLSEGSDSLQLGGGWTAAGIEYHWGTFAVAIQAGLGAVYFGVPGSEGRAGLWLPMRLGASFSLGHGLQLGALLSPAWIVTFGGGVKSSFTLVAGGRLLVAL